MRTLLLITIVLLTNLSVKAQNFEGKPHTCTTKKAGNYQVELAGCGNTIDIYVYDNSGKPVRNKIITGHVEFFYLDETILRSELVQYYRTNALSAKIVGPGFYNCRVTITIGVDVFSVYFDNECDLRAQR